MGISEAAANNIVLQLHRRRQEVLRQICDRKYAELTKLDVIVDGCKCRLLTGCIVRLDELSADHAAELRKLVGRKPTQQLVDSLADAFDTRLLILPMQLLELDSIGNWHMTLSAHRVFARLAEETFRGHRMPLYDFISRISFPKWIYLHKDSAVHRNYTAQLERYSIVTRKCPESLCPSNEVARVVEYVPLPDSVVSSIGQRVDTPEKFTESLHDELMCNSSHHVICVLDAFVLLMCFCVDYGVDILESILHDPTVRKPLHRASL